jgi:hypothetical protein
MIHDLGFAAGADDGGGVGSTGGGDDGATVAVNCYRSSIEISNCMCRWRSSSAWYRVFFGSNWIVRLVLDNPFEPCDNNITNSLVEKVRKLRTFDTEKECDKMLVA